MATRTKKKAAPASPANTLKDHSVSPAEMAAKMPQARTAAAPAKAKTADTKTAEKIVAETKSEAETKADSLGDKITKSGLIYHEDQLTGQNWAGSAKGDPCKGTEHRCRHTPLAENEPRAGMTVYPKSGAPFAIGMDFQRGQGALGWLAVRSPGGAALL